MYTYTYMNLIICVCMLRCMHLSLSLSIYIHLCLCASLSVCIRAYTYTYTRDVYINTTSFFSSSECQALRSLSWQNVLGLLGYQLCRYLCTSFFYFCISHVIHTYTKAQSEKHCRHRGASSGQKTRGCIEGEEPGRRRY